MGRLLDRLLGRRSRPAPATAPAPAAAAVPVGPALPAPVVTLLGLAAAVVVLGGIRAAQGIVAPILLAFVLAIAVHPVQAWLRTVVPGWLATTVTLLVTYAALTLFAGALALSVLRFADQVPQYQDELNSLVDQGEDLLLEVGVDQAQINEFVQRFDLNQIFSIAIDLIQGLAGVLTDLAFILALLFFVLIDAGVVQDKMAAIKAVRPRVAASMRGFTHGVRQYLVVTAVFGAIVAALDVVLLMYLGVPLPLLWGLLAFLASFVPTIGLIVGLVPPAIIGLLDGGPLTGLWVVVGYLVINNTIDNFVKPKFVGDAVGLSITAAFLSLIVWGFVLGPLGALLAIPASLLVRAVLTDDDPRSAWVGMLVGDRPPEGEELERIAREARQADGGA
ncbi:AI-2E family transporter [Aquipuribacter sp. MA13-6]|uniref:AI-2E family transporter n=1 Tax=unclassified Aquipuribacter TaxID=2635084 RepID=UPI003EEAE405